MTSLPTDEEGNSEGFGITFLEATCGSQLSAPEWAVFQMQLKTVLMDIW